MQNPSSLLPSTSPIYRAIANQWNTWVFSAFYRKELSKILAGEWDHNTTDGILFQSRSELLGQSPEGEKTYQAGVNILGKNFQYKVMSLAKNQLRALRDSFKPTQNLTDAGEISRLSQFIQRYCHQKWQYCRAIKNSGQTINLNELDGERSRNVTCVENNLFLAQLLAYFYEIHITFHQIGPHPFLEVTSDASGLTASTTIDILNGEIRVYPSKAEYFRAVGRAGFGINIPLDSQKTH